MDVVLDLAQPLHDPVVAPPFEWPSQVDADQFPQHARIDALLIVSRDQHSSSPLWVNEVMRAP